MEPWNDLIVRVRRAEPDSPLGRIRATGRRWVVLRCHYEDEFKDSGLCTWSNIDRVLERHLEGGVASSAQLCKST